MADRYFKFEIAKNDDGTPVSFSYGWHGTMPHCLHGEVVIDLYNDEYGIVHEITQEARPFTPKEIKLLSDKETKFELAKITRPAKEIYDEKLEEVSFGR